MNTQLNSTDILADLESFLADTPTGGLDFETTAQVIALLWEVNAHVAMLRTTKPKGNAGTACTYLERAAVALLNLLGDNDQVIDRAHELIEALPAGGRRQALAAYMGGA